MTNISQETKMLLNFVTQEAEAIHDAEILEEARWKELGVEPEPVVINLPKDLAFKIKANYIVDPMRITTIFQETLRRELMNA
ncbi:hypothetical protein FACS1894125_1360 [Actinomycetota bacterium]|nr:hypothetical protein FACS1894125_1360 [Actinomycetota bacterium]